jgi:hypothetical protein
MQIHRRTKLGLPFECRRGCQRPLEKGRDSVPGTNISCIDGTDSNFGCCQTEPREHDSLELLNPNLARLRRILFAKHGFKRENPRSSPCDSPPLTQASAAYLANKRCFMTYAAHEGHSRISRKHSMAICREIGERLGTRLDQDPVRMSPHLIMLMTRLRGEPSGIQSDPNP